MYFQKYRLIIPFMLPALILYGVFVLYPYAQAFYISLTSWSGVSADKPFVGLKNYQDLLTDGRFLDALLRNGQLLIVLPLGAILLALAFAALFTQGGTGILGSSFYRVVYFFPQVISAVIVGILFQYVYNPRYGLLNTTLEKMGLDSLTRTWLGDPSTILWAIAFVFIWSAVGFYMVIFIASMQSIPTSFYEAAVLDGATRWRQFRDITLPLMWETIRTALIYIGIQALDMFVLVQVMTGGGSTSASRNAEVVAVYMYIEAFTKSRWGAAAAVGVILLLLTMLLSVVIMRVTKRETYEY
ncbi:MAG TPA: sugar ABC transporter permease [Thermomicrobiales bacterium]|nr:sugar ABC transporter permease [Thermomicrobiales bacterium]